MDSTSQPAPASPPESPTRPPQLSVRRLRSTSSHESEAAAFQVAMGGALPTDPNRDYETLRALYLAQAQKCDTLEARLAFHNSPRLLPGGQGEGDALVEHQLMHGRKVSTLGSGTRVRLSGEELAAMHQIFALFDTHGTGKISASNLQVLHQKLGEPITDEEARDMVKEIGSGRDSISFDEFVAYWDGSHPSCRQLGFDAPAFSLDDIREKKRQWYQAKFKFAKARLTNNPTVARIYTKLEGVPPSHEFRVRFFYDDEAGSHQISPWHDIPLKNAGDNTFNMICEIPKWSRAKYELATGELYNPIKQDSKRGILREYAYGDMLVNYGCLPQTWEDPNIISPETGVRGDSDPIDIVDIGTRMWATGSIIQVKVLGILAMVDSGETDWKVIAINTEDPYAEILNDIDDVQVHMPGALAQFVRWLKFYKAPDLATFAFDGKVQNRDFALRVIEETHEQWRRLIEARGKSAVLDVVAGTAATH